MTRKNSIEIQFLFPLLDVEKYECDMREICIMYNTCCIMSNKTIKAIVGVEWDRKGWSIDIVLSAVDQRVLMGVAVRNVSPI